MPQKTQLETGHLASLRLSFPDTEKPSICSPGGAVHTVVAPSQRH